MMYFVYGIFSFLFVWTNTMKLILSVVYKIYHARFRYKLENKIKAQEPFIQILFMVMKKV